MNLLRTELLIDGQFVPAQSGQTFTTYSACNLQPLAEVAKAGLQDLDRAVVAARRAFEDGRWSGMQPTQRGRFLREIAQRIRDQSRAIAELETRNSGKTIGNALNEVDAAANVFDYYAGAMDKFYGDTIPMGDAVLDFTLREPIGVIAAITPWNFPFMAAAWKVAPALAAGCTMILKPASYSPLTALALGQIVIDAGVPAGVLNILPGPGATLGERIATHPGIDKITFTGETKTGATLLKLGADDIKRITLELGGKSPNIIFADADLEKAAVQAVKAGFGNAGQSCSARTRVFVERSVYDQFLARFVAATKEVKLGDPLQASTEIGPLISQSQWDSVHGYVQLGLAEGCTLAIGGARPKGLDGAAFYAPTILANARNDMRVAQEEIFGPVVVVIPFETESDVVAMANDNMYGLNGSVWTRDIARGLRVARALKSGMISINSHGSASRYGYLAPFGGYKRSGLGRELGLHALALYTEIKNVFVDLEN